MTDQSRAAPAPAPATYSCTCCGGSRPKVVVVLPPSLRADVDRRRVVQVVREALKDDKVKIKDMLVEFTWVTGDSPIAEEEESESEEQKHSHDHVVIESLPASTDPAAADVCAAELGADDKSVPMDQVDAEDGQVEAASRRYEEDQPAQAQDIKDDDAAALPCTPAAAPADTASADASVDSRGGLLDQEQAAAVPLPDIHSDEVDSAGGQQQQEDDGWSQVELVARLAQHVSSPKPIRPTIENTQPITATKAEPTSKNSTNNSKDTRTATPKPKLGADLFQIIVDNLSPTATDGAIRALVPPDLKPARIVITPARPTTATSKADGGNELPKVRGAMFDFTSRMDTITFWNSVRKSHAERFLAHLTVPEIDMTFLARPEIASLLEVEGLPPNYEFNPPARPKKILKRPTTEASPSPDTNSLSIARRSSPTVQTAPASTPTAGAPASTPAPTTTDSYTLPVRRNRPPGIFLGSLTTRITQPDLVPLVPAHLQSACTINIHPPILLRPEHVLVGRATISLPDVPRAAELLRHLTDMRHTGDLEKLKAPEAREVVVTCMPEVRRYRHVPAPAPAPGVSDDDAKDRAASSREGSTHDDDDADSAVVRNSPLIPLAQGRAPRDEGVVAQAQAREAFVVHMGNLKPDVCVADIHVLVPTDLAPAAVHVPDAADAKGNVGHARVVFTVEAEATRFGEYVKDLKREKESVLLRLAKDGCEVTVAVFPEAQRRASGGDVGGARTWWPRRASVVSVEAESAKVEDQVQVVKENGNEKPKVQVEIVQAAKEHVEEIKTEGKPAVVRHDVAVVVHRVAAEPGVVRESAAEAVAVPDAAEPVPDAATVTVDTVVVEKVSEVEPVVALEDGAGGWDSIEVASSAALSWVDKPSTSALQDDFAGAQPPAQQPRTRPRTKSLASNLSADSATNTSANKQPNATRITSPTPKQPLIHLNQLHPESTTDSLSHAFPPGMPRPKSIKMIPARATGPPHRQIYSAGANLYYASEHDAIAAFDVFQAMTRDGHLAGMAAPNSRVTVSVLKVQGRFKPDERSTGDAGIRAPSAQPRAGNGFDPRAQSVQARRANVGAAGRSQSTMSRVSAQDVRAQSVQPNRGGAGGGGFDARSQSVQRPRENYGQRFSKWKEPRGSANGADESSKYTRSGRLKVAEPIEEVVFEPPKAAPHVAPLYHPPWAKAPPAALPVVVPEPSTVSYVHGASSSAAPAAVTKPASKASVAKTSFFTSMTTIKLHCVHLRHLSADVTDNMLHYLIPNHWAGDQQPSAVEFKPPTETEEGSGVFRRQAKYFFNESKDAKAFVEFVRDKDVKGKLGRLKQDPNKALVVSASHAPVCVPPSAVFLYPGQVSVS